MLIVSVASHFASVENNILSDIRSFHMSQPSPGSSGSSSSSSSQDQLLISSFRPERQSWAQHEPTTRPVFEGVTPRSIFEGVKPSPTSRPRTAPPEAAHHRQYDIVQLQQSAPEQQQQERDYTRVREILHGPGRGRGAGQPQEEGRGQGAGRSEGRATQRPHSGDQDRHSTWVEEQQAWGQQGGDPARGRPHSGDRRPQADARWTQDPWHEEEQAWGSRGSQGVARASRGPGGGDRGHQEQWHQEQEAWSSRGPHTGYSWQQEAVWPQQEGWPGAQLQVADRRRSGGHQYEDSQPAYSDLATSLQPHHHQADRQLQLAVPG